MALTITKIEKRYVYNGMTLPAIPGATDEEMRTLLSHQYPELLTAELIAGEVANGVQEMTFRRMAGTKA